MLRKGKVVIIKKILTIKLPIFMGIREFKIRQLSIFSFLLILPTFDYSINNNKFRYN